MDGEEAAITRPKTTTATGAELTTTFDKDATNDGDNCAAGTRRPTAQGDDTTTSDIDARTWTLRRMMMINEACSPQTTPHAAGKPTTNHHDEPRPTSLPPLLAPASPSAVRRTPTRRVTSRGGVTDSDSRAPYPLATNAADPDAPTTTTHHTDDDRQRTAA